MDDMDFIKTGLKVIVFQHGPMDNVLWELRTGSVNELEFHDLKTAAIGHPISVKGKLYKVKDITTSLIEDNWVVRIYVE